MSDPLPPIMGVILPATACLASVLHSRGVDDEEVERCDGEQ